MLIPGYEIGGVLGQGGFGTVYEAEQLSVRRRVALKVDSRVLATERDRRRFMREVTTAGRLSGHPHVVAVHDAGVLADGRPYMVMELCPNGSLADRLRERGPFPAEEVRDLGVRIGDALAAAHGAGVLHRDLKPGNLLVNRYGMVALADFGLAAEQVAGAEMSATRNALTPAFAPPEAFRHEEPTAAGDVYSLAATLYALLRGRPPHYPETGNPTIMQLAASLRQPVPPLPGLPQAFNDLLRGALAFEPKDRPPSAAAFRDALAALDLAGAGPVTRRAEETGPAWPPPTEPAAERALPVRRSRTHLLVGVAALAVASLALGGVGVMLYQGSRDDPGRTASADPKNGADEKDPAADPYPGIDVSDDGCAAAKISGLEATCTKSPECWDGIEIRSGDARGTKGVCTGQHTWETFAVAPLPDPPTWNYAELVRNDRPVDPAMRRVCGTRTLLASRKGAGARIPARRWVIDVLPPSEASFKEGVRYYRCIARLDTGLMALTKPAFG
ncbi:serine/threonine-protein kinase [Actinocorallia longicatena]|uniref:non-specific serine/threonine protein kinase n=1 Tax=Actinocorallia longicatena TaxID=111803 RepID=A0ABP6QI19_9ACTN